MSRLTVRLPETLHQQLIHLAESEGVSLNQYIVYTLTQQVSSLVQAPDAGSQQQAFTALLQQLGQASASEIKTVLANREPVQPESELNAERVARFQQRLQAHQTTDNQTPS